MANNCWNYVVFNGDATQIKKVRSKFKEYEKTNYFTEFGDFVLDKGKIGDTVEELQKRHKDSFYTYGTKWWEFEIEYDLDDEVLTISGDSAWSPPISLIEQMCIHYSLQADMDYEECGDDFAGVIEFDENGIKTHKEMTYHEYRYADDINSWMDNLYYNFEDETDRKELEHAMKTYHDYAHKTHVDEFINFVLKSNSAVNS